MVFSADKPNIEYAHFYYESPSVARIDHGVKENFETNKWAAIRDTMLWNGKETIKIDPKNHIYYSLPIERSEEIWSQPQKGFWASILLASMPSPRPQTIWPLMVNIHADEIRNQYEISFERFNGDILITANSKKKVQLPFSYSKIRILLDS
jgi:hypothetical protein